MKTIKLSNSDNFVKVDDEDYPVLSRLNWYVSDCGYAITDSPVKHLKMHKLIIGPIRKNAVIDHIDRDKLNNQKSNLRVVSQKENCRNTDKYNESRFFYYSTKKKKWIIDSRSLGVRYIQVDTPVIARRVVTRLMLGFPKDLALSEANTQTISITNWERFGITYSDYIEARKLGITIKNYRRRLSRMGKISKRGPAKKKKEENVQEEED